MPGDLPRGLCPGPLRGDCGLLRAVGCHGCSSPDERPGCTRVTQRFLGDTFSGSLVTRLAAIRAGPHFLGLLPRRGHHTHPQLPGPRQRRRATAKAITCREEEILKLVGEGHSSREIADMLVISTKTVERHRASLLQKLGLRDRLELTRYATEPGSFGP
ncbi:response regulator transcription factor [Saccharopolyspora sp. NPDC000995]